MREDFQPTVALFIKSKSAYVLYNYTATQNEIHWWQQPLRRSTLRRILTTAAAATRAD